MSDPTTTDTQSGSAPDTAVEGAPVAVPDTASASSGTPILVWIVYTLGILAGVVFLASVAFVVLADATTHGGGSGVNVSVPALVIWAALLLGAAGTWLWRRRHARR